jgi:hypothetical protein
MAILRHYRSTIGLFVAAFLFAAAGLPGVLAAAQGVQLQAPICGPSATDLPTSPGPAAESHSDHCKIFPCGGLPGVASRADSHQAFALYVSTDDVPAERQAGPTFFRAELTPLNGRAPPSRS